MAVYMSDYEDFLLDEDTKRQFLSAIRKVASTSPEELTMLFTVTSLVIGIKDIDKELGDRKNYYYEVEKQGKVEGISPTDKANFEQVQLETVRELTILFDMAEKVETALRYEDYIYEYETSMSDVSAIIYSHRKKEL